MPFVNFDPAISAYAQAALPYVEHLSAALGKAGRLFQAPDFFNETWRLDVATQLAIIQVAHEQLSMIQPPSELFGVHSTLLNATRQCSAVAQNVATAIDALNGSLMLQAANEVQACTAGLYQATNQIEEWIATQPAPAVVFQPALTATPIIIQSAQLQFAQPTAIQGATIPPLGPCDPSYPDICIPPPPPDLDCPEIPQFTDFHVIGDDPHDFDRDNDSIGCESTNWE
jgi:hypothetical protein